MKCPTCGKCMRVRNTYPGDVLTKRYRVCEDASCEQVTLLTVETAENVGPPRQLADVLHRSADWLTTDERAWKAARVLLRWANEIVNEEMKTDAKS